MEHNQRNPTPKGVLQHREAGPLGGCVKVAQVRFSIEPNGGMSEYLVSNFRMLPREIMLFIGIPMGRSIMISNATNPLKELEKNLY